MNTYEIVTIFAPESEKNAEDFLGQTKKILTGAAGKILKEEKWGRRLLAYPIAKNNEGIYFYWLVQMMPQEVSRIDRRFAIDENVLRYLIVRTDVEIKEDVKEVQVEEVVASSDVEEKPKKKAVVRKKTK